MRFARPELLWLLGLVPFVSAWLVWSVRRRNRGIISFAGGAFSKNLVQASRGEVESDIVPDATA